ncbi:MAG: hypothetical protein KJZ98_13305 [Burkholderiaceae bacterium]|jgi:hypothetical protein|nr:hypothetical protein [Burkholderiaceae bacterium]MEB2351610.1 hypothetical protein [Burkholderiaceae bacterium]
MWSPVKGQPVSNKEIVGRRVFGTDYLNKTDSAKGRKDAFKMTVFVEDRPDSNISFDRVGLRNADKAVLQHLRPLCERHAKAKSSVFSGWAALPVEHIRNEPHKYEVTATPDDENAYHADVFLLGMAPTDRNRVAFVLATLAKPLMEPADTSRPMSESLARLLTSAVDWLKKRFR